MDDRLVEDMIKMRIGPEDVKLLPEGRGWLLVEFGGETKQEADDRARVLMDSLKAVQPPSMKLFDDPRAEHTIWEVRKSGLGATAHVPAGRLRGKVGRTRRSTGKTGSVPPKAARPVRQVSLRVRPLRPFWSRLRPYAHRF